MRDRRCPFVATIRMTSLRSSHNTPFRIGRLSSVDAAKLTWLISFCRSLDVAIQLSWKSIGGKLGNSSFGIPSSLKRERPHSRLTRCSPELVTRTAALGSSRTISTSFRAGIVTAPSASTSAGTTVLTAMSKSVPDKRTPSPVASTRMLDSTGSVVFEGTLAATATSPS